MLLWWNVNKLSLISSIVVCFQLFHAWSTKRQSRIDNELWWLVDLTTLQSNFDCIEVSSISHIDSFISHFLHKSKEENGAKDYSANILQYLVSFNENYKINESQTTNRRGQATIHNFSLTKGNYKKYTIRDSLRVVVTHENRLRSRDKKCKCSSAHNNNNAETT